MVLLLSIVTAIIAAIVVSIYRSKSTVQFPHVQVYDLFQRNYGSSDAVGKVAIVTGSTSGIGRDVTAQLYKYGATVVVAARNEKKAAEVMQEIIAEAPASRGKLEFIALDTSDLDSVKEFAAAVLQQHRSIDFLVNNAGIHYMSYPGKPVTNTDVSITTKQGFDTLFATNYLGHFYLTELLLPHVTDKIVNVASTYHFEADGSTLRPPSATATDATSDAIDATATATATAISALVDAANGAGRDWKHKLRAYGVSKLAQILHTGELQKRLDRITTAATTATTTDADTTADANAAVVAPRVISVCPGWVQTGILGPDANLLTDFVRLNAFPRLAGVLAPMRALFDGSLKGGEFVTNHAIPLQQFAWFESLLSAATQWGLREVMVNALATLLLLRQSASYGLHVTAVSPEARDPLLQQQLYDWSHQQLTARGYLMPQWQQ